MSQPKPTELKIIKLTVTDKIRTGERMVLLITLMLFILLLIGYITGELSF